jgi:hypothetical protein
VSLGEATVPSVVGDTESFAEQAISLARLTYRTYGINDCAVPGSVISQAPPAGTVTAPGAQVDITIATCTDNGIYEIQSNDSGMCLQPVNVNPGAAIVQETCTGSTAQQWIEQSSPYSGNEDWFINRSSRLCLDVHGGDTDGAPIEQWVSRPPSRTPRGSGPRPSSR